MFTIWLKPGSEEKVEEIVGNTLKIEIDKISQRKKIVIDADPFDPTIFVPPIPEDFIESFTCKATMSKNSKHDFVSEGIFKKHKTGTIVRIKRRGSTKYDAYIKAPNMKEILKAYSKLSRRKASLNAAPNWIRVEKT